MATQSIGPFGSGSGGTPAHRAGSASYSSTISGIARMQDMTRIQISSGCAAAKIPTTGTRIINEALLLMNLHHEMETRPDLISKNHFTIAWFKHDNWEAVACHVGLKTRNREDYIEGTQNGIPKLYLKRTASEKTGWCLARLVRREHYLKTLRPKNNPSADAEIRRIENSSSCDFVLLSVLGCPMEPDEKCNQFLPLKYGLDLHADKLREDDKTLLEMSQVELIRFANSFRTFWSMYEVVTDPV